VYKRNSRVANELIAALSDLNNTASAAALTTKESKQSAWNNIKEKVTK
jgi:hypothetical protein